MNCKKFSSMEDRKRIIRESNRCFNCLRKGHVGSNCRSLSNCKMCKGRHHTSACTRPKVRFSNTSDERSSHQPGQVSHGHSRALDPQIEPFDPSATCYKGTHNCVLLQTATVHAFNLEQPTKGETLHVLMDSGSQSSYITSRACKALSLRKLGTKPVSMSFGSKKERHERCSVVHVGVETRDHEHIELKLLSVEHM